MQQVPCQCPAHAPFVAGRKSADLSGSNMQPGFCRVEVSSRMLAAMTAGIGHHDDSFMQNSEQESVSEFEEPGQANNSEELWGKFDRRCDSTDWSEQEFDSDSVESEQEFDSDSYMMNLAESEQEVDITDSAEMAGLMEHWDAEEDIHIRTPTSEIKTTEEEAVSDSLHIQHHVLLPQGNQSGPMY